ncbi:C2H2-type domain-containing protein [Caenorhabditis elegans]|uniref:C2H2-type domain-containing protein n=1 Tax=Caenorhabditis elegans TaxID=6239 RepID=Q09659_CAEEL|nr:C2H2-type domain-containing protein [Caenorhabditis elegans]CCD64865.2 C2H2-type domain-containing protein [Caenorhabditis elegans]|eukprot:NP_495056.3 Uncharacterized protein CELE_ZK177.3 [Caenorhabditis elegans]
MEESPTKTFKCPKCWNKFENKPKLITHVDLECKHKYFRCELCDFKSTQKTGLTSHYHGHIRQSNVIHCPYCKKKKTFKSRNNLMVHVHHYHPTHINEMKQANLESAKEEKMKTMLEKQAKEAHEFEISQPAVFEKDFASYDLPMFSQCPPMNGIPVSTPIEYPYSQNPYQDHTPFDSYPYPNFHPQQLPLPTFENNLPDIATYFDL